MKDNERTETCYFCGQEYIETWPPEDLEATVCPECAKMGTLELIEKYPEKMAKLGTHLSQ